MVLALLSAPSEPIAYMFVASVICVTMKFPMMNRGDYGNEQQVWSLIKVINILHHSSNKGYIFCIPSHGGIFQFQRNKK
jgi:hypothetical protein